MFLRPDLHDQGHTQRPLSAHAQRGYESERSELQRGLGKIRDPCEQRVAEDCQAHGPNPTDPVAEPTKDEAAKRSAEQEKRRNDPHPLADIAIAHRARR